MKMSPWKRLALGLLLLLAAFGGCRYWKAFAPRGGLQIAADGSFENDGKPVYLIANLIYGTPTTNAYADLPPGMKIPPGSEWIYCQPPARAQFDRLGFNATGGETSTTWMRKYRPEKSFWQADSEVDWKGIAPGYYNNGLPVYVDFTCSDWTHGALRPEPGRLPSPDAFSAGNCHFMPYSVVTEEGWRLYREMFQSGARELLANGVRPFVYELFNEPTYEDTAPKAREALAKELAKLPSAAPSAAAKVETMKFHERAFARAIRQGKAALREIDPEARTCFQPLGNTLDKIDPLLANETTDVVVTPTGGGDPFDVLVSLAVAGKRPLVDGEAYMGNTRASHRHRILLEYARGLNGTYYFKMDRPAAWNPVWKGPDGVRREAEDFPYRALNPLACPPEAFKGIQDAAHDIAAVNDLFTPRDRGVPARVALLYSQPTLRLARALGRANGYYAREAAMALLAARLPVKVLFEEQLDKEHLEGVRMIVAAGVDATLPETNARLRKWIAQGGTLVTVANLPNLTEWGEPSPTAFLKPQTETIGKGRHIHLAQRPSTRDAVRTYRELAAAVGVRPSCLITDVRTGEEVPGVECAAARRGKAEGFILVNNDLAPRAVRLRPQAVGAGRSDWIDVTTGLRLARTDEGDILVRLLPNVPVVIRAADGPAATVSETPEAFFAGLSDWFASHRLAISTDAYYVPPADAVCVDLRAAANGKLEDRFGAMPWGRKVCEGVPFDFIRIDQNGEKSGVFLKKNELVSVAVQGRVQALYVLFDAPENAKGPLFAGRLEAEKGSPVPFGFAAPAAFERTGWRNMDGRPLYLVQWTNPQPEKTFNQLCLEARQDGISIAAVTIQRPDSNRYAVPFVPSAVKCGAWGRVSPALQDGMLNLRVSDETTDWSGCTLTLARPIPLAAGDVAGRSLVFELNLGATPSGPAFQPAQIPQISVTYKKKNGEIVNGSYVWDGFFPVPPQKVDADPRTWQEARIPLRRLAGEDAREILKITVQFKIFESQRVGLLFRGMRLE